MCSVKVFKNYGRTSSSASRLAFFLAMVSFSTLTDFISLNDFYCKYYGTPFLRFVIDNQRKCVREREGGGRQIQ